MLVVLDADHQGPHEVARAERFLDVVPEVIDLVLGPGIRTLIGRNDELLLIHSQEGREICLVSVKLHQPPDRAAMTVTIRPMQDCANWGRASPSGRSAMESRKARSSRRSATTTAPV